jgi:hypothetical protein
MGAVENALSASFDGDAMFEIMDRARLRQSQPIMAVLSKVPTENKMTDSLPSMVSL